MGFGNDVGWDTGRELVGGKGGIAAWCFDEGSGSALVWSE